MGKRVFTPLDLSLVEEGRFIEQANADLMECQRRLLAFRKEYGDKAEKAKAKLQIEVTLVCENPEEELFTIKALTKTSMPSRPASVSVAMAAEGEDGEPCLFVRNSGSDAETPRQSKLATDDGRPIDIETGKPKRK
jgi:hypothetical protein